MQAAPALGNDEQALELRVLSGRQAGARALLQAQAGGVTLGHLPENDIVLRDAPFARAEFTWEDGRWFWREEGEAPVGVARGQGVRHGRLALWLSDPRAPWDSQGPSQWALDRTEPEAQRDSDSTGADDTEPPEPRNEAPPQASANPTPTVSHTSDSEPPVAAGDGTVDPLLISPAQDSHGLAPRTERRPARRSWPAMAAPAVLALGLLSAAWLIGRTGDVQGTGSTVAASPPPSPVEDAQQNLARIQAILERQTLGNGLRAEAGADGRIVLRGVVPSDEALEKMLRPVAQSGIRVKLRTLTDREFDLRVQALANRLPQGTTAKAVAPGRVRVAGGAALPSESGASALAQVRALLAKELPEALDVDIEGSVQAKASDTRVDTKAILSGDAPVRLPSVMAVVGGPSAHVVLKDGRRLLPGGSVAGLQLSTIADTEVTFIDSSGRSLKMPR
jgi:hypothetical protein